MTYYTIDGIPDIFTTKRKLDRYRHDNLAVGDDAVHAHDLPVDAIKDLYKLSRKPPKCPTCGK